MTDDLETLLRDGLGGDLVGDAPILRDLAGSVRRRRHRRRMRIVQAASAAVAVGAAVTALVVITPWVSAPGIVGAGKHHARDVTVVGELMQQQHHDVLCLPTLFALSGGDHRGDPCFAEVTLRGVPSSFQHEGTVRVVGRYDGSTIRVGTIAVTNDSEFGQPNPAEPPCAPPPGGWANTNGNTRDAAGAVQVYEVDHPDLVVASSESEPTPGVEVTTIAVTDVKVVEQALAKYARSLCIVRSRYTAEQVHSAYDKAAGLLGAPYGVYETGPEPSDDGQPVIQVGVVRDSPALRRAIADLGLPAGLVTVDAWLPF